MTFVNLVPSVYANVAQYGTLDPTGATDNTSIFQTAINAVYPTSPPFDGVGGAVIVPKGTFLISNLTITYPIMFLGDGWGTILKLKNGANSYIFSFTPNNGFRLNGAVFSNLKLDCNAANQTGTSGGIDGFGACYCIFDHLWIEAPYTYGISLHQDNLGGYGHHNTVRDCWFHNGTLSPANIGTGLRLDNSDENQIIGNKFESCGGTSSIDACGLKETASLQNIIGNIFIANPSVNGIVQCNVQNRNRIIGNTFDGGTNTQLFVNGDNNILGNEFYQPINNSSCIWLNGAGTKVLGNSFESSPTNNASRSAVYGLASSGSNYVGRNTYRTDGTWSHSIIEGATQNAVDFYIEDFGATGNGSTDDTTAIANCLTAAGGQPIHAGPGTFIFSSTLAVNAQGAGIIGAGKDITIFQTTSTTIDGIKVGNTQTGGHVQLNYIALQDFTVQMPNSTTHTAVNVTGMGVGGYIRRVKTGQGTIGFLLEDIDRCVFEELESDNTIGQAYVLRQGITNTWGTATFLNCAAVLNTASTICLQFDADSDQGSPNKLDRVTFENFHFFANPGTSGTVGVKALIGATGMKFLGCLYENTLRHNDIEAEVDAAWDTCSMLNTNFGTTPTTDGWYLNNFAQISIYDCNVQQMTNLFNGVSGSPRVGLWGINKNGGNLTNIFTGSYGAKFGNDTVLAGDNTLAAGINGQQYGLVFTHQLQGGPPLEIKPNSDSTTGIKLENAAGTALVTLDTTNGRLISNGTTLRSGSISATAPDPGNNGTISTSTEIAKVTPTANETGIILASGVQDGQFVVIENKGNFTLTMAASGTSHVAAGTAAVIPALRSILLTWDNGAGLWY